MVVLIKTGRKKAYLQNNLKYMVIVFFAIFLPKAIIALGRNPIYVADELGAMATAAEMAGLPWDSLMGKIPYYGYGYHFIFAPLYLVTQNPFIIYRTVLVSYVVLHSLIGIIAYYILQHYFDIKQKSYLCLGAIGCAYFTLTQATSITNEHILLFIIWIAALLLFKLQEYYRDKKRRILYTVLLCLLFSYAMTVHERAIVFWPVLIVVSLAYFIINRRNLISLPVGLCFGIGGFIASRVLNNYVLNAVWLKYAEGNVNNVNAFANVSNMTKLFDPSYWRVWLNIIFGQLGTAAVFATGLLALAVVFAIFVVVKSFRKNGVELFNSNVEYRNLFFIGFLFFGLCAVISLGGQSVSWLDNAYSSMQLGVGAADDPNVNFNRVFVYLRYFIPYLGPIMMLLLAAVYLRFEKLNACWKIAGIALFATQVYWLVSVLPYLYNSISTATVFIPFALAKYTGEASVATYLPGIIWSLVSLVFCYVLYRKNKPLLLAVIFTIGLFFQYMYYGFNSENTWYSRADAGYVVMRQTLHNEEVPDTIYVPYEAMAYTYQMMLPRYEVICDVPDEDVEAAILFTNRFYGFRFSNLLSSQGYLCAQLDFNEYIYVKGERLQAQINLVLQQLGYEDLHGEVLYNYQETVVSTQNGERAYVSNGEEGALIFGPYLALDPGTYTIRFEIELLDYTTKKDIVVCDVVANSGNTLLRSATYSAEDFADGRLTVEFELSLSNIVQSMEFRVHTVEGARVLLYDVTCENINNTYIMGLDDTQDFANLVDVLEKEQISDTIYFLSPNNWTDVDISTLEAALPAYTFEVLSYLDLASAKDTLYLLYPRSQAWEKVIVEDDQPGSEDEEEVEFVWEEIPEGDIELYYWLSYEVLETFEQFYLLCVEVEFVYQ